MASPSTEKPVLRALTGCTGVGKTEWALHLAQANNAEIISCDSLLFYRGMDIGTAKPTRSELALVPHHLIDCCDVSERMDVARFVALARDALEQITARGRVPLIVGGSGFYLRAFFAPVVDDVAVSLDLRMSVAQLTKEQALGRLRELNAQGLGSLDAANPRRVVRALERCLASGKTLDVLAKDFAEQVSPFADWDLELTQLDREPDDLNQRIEMRVAAMMSAALVDEVRRLLAVGLSDNPSAARAIGYREVIDVLQGRLDATKLTTEIERNTRRLVKKQRTWFRTQLPAHRVLNAGSVKAVSELFRS
ncbi:MAG: tRNA (adenosine(37)-N6)-dimethylallyltransferase MiaA [Opitutus sp.]